MIVYSNSAPLGDAELSALHALAFGEPGDDRRWSAQLGRHSLGWVSAHADGELVGFINVAWDGDRHAFLLDTAVHPDHRRQGIGTELVHRAVALAREAGCHYLHVNTDDELVAFYRQATDMDPTNGLVMAFETLASTTPGVVRVADTVRRPGGSWVPTTVSLLHHLESEGFPAPRPLGSDDDGRQILSWIRGVPTWLEHHRWWGTDGALARAGRLIRHLHDALDRFQIPAGATWRGGWDRPEDGTGPICHHDLAPWNMVAGADGELYVIDWDGAGPGDRMAELAYAACGLVPMRRDHKCAELGWLRPPDRVGRLEVFRRAYGLSDQDRPAMADAIIASMRSGVTFGEQMYAEGREPWASWWAADLGAGDREDLAAAEAVVEQWRRHW